MVDKRGAGFYDVGVTASIENVLKQTRSKILNCLRVKGRLTVEELASTVGLSKVCIRRHLDLLGRDELVAYDIEKQDRGRPSHVYYLTAKSESLFPTRYVTFAQGMLRQIGQQFGESAIQAILAGIAGEALTRFKCELESHPGEARVHEFVTLLNRGDYEAHLAAHQDGCYVIEQRNCPMLALALEYPQICDEELRVYRDLFDVEVRRDCRIAEGFSSCIYKVFLSSEQREIHSQSEASLEH